MSNQDTLNKVQGILTALQTGLSDLGGVLSVIVPAAAPVITGLEVADNLAQHVVNAIEDVPQNDAAALAAGNISISTGNPSLDARLALVEQFIESGAPILQAIAKHLGMTAPQAPSQVVAQAAAQTTAGS